MSITSDADVEKYDRQLIVVLLNGSDDMGLMKQAVDLNGKRRDPPLPTEVVAIQHHPTGVSGGAEDALQQAMAGRRQVSGPVTQRSRLYLVGHGEGRARTLSGWPADAVADLLAVAGVQALRLLSIVGDGAGWDVQRAHSEQTETGAISFASELHRRLLVAHGVETTVNARVGEVQVRDDGRKQTAQVDGAGVGLHHAALSKLHFSWDGGQQRCRWAY